MNLSKTTGYNTPLKVLSRTPLGFVILPLIFTFIFDFIVSRKFSALIELMELVTTFLFGDGGLIAGSPKIQKSNLLKTLVPIIFVRKILSPRE